MNHLAPIDFSRVKGAPMKSEIGRRVMIAAANTSPRYADDFAPTKREAAKLAAAYRLFRYGSKG